MIAPSLSTPDPNYRATDKLRVIVLAVALGLTFVVIPAVVVFSWSPRKEESPRAFSQNEWRAGGVRLTMVDDLMHNRSVLGMHRTDVKELLGQPDLEGSHEVQYRLGRGGLGPEDNWLVLVLAANRVDAWRIERR